MYSSLNVAELIFWQLLKVSFPQQHYARFWLQMQIWSLPRPPLISFLHYKKHLVCFCARVYTLRGEALHGGRYIFIPSDVIRKLLAVWLNPWLCESGIILKNRIATACRIYRMHVMQRGTVSLQQLIETDWLLTCSGFISQYYGFKCNSVPYVCLFAVTLRFRI